MSEWKTVRLGDICTPKQWKTLSMQDLELSGYPVYGANGIIGYYHDYNHENSTIVIGCRGSCGTVTVSEPYSWINGNAMCLDNLDTEIDIEYLKHYLINYDFRKVISGTTQPQITRENINKVLLRLFSYDKQKQIATVLNKCTKLITENKQILQKYDMLIKSRFIEMFGEPSKNQMNWKKCPVIEEADCMVPGRDKPKSFTGNIPWITIDDLNVLNRTKKSKKGLGLTAEEIEEVKRETIPEGSVIMSCVGNLGICSIADVPLIINQQLHSFQCKSNLIPEFLMYCLTYQKSYMEMKANFSTVAYMNKTICNSIPIIVPPIDLQNDFAAFVQQIDKSKFAVQKSLEKAESLYKSLMQEYFG